MTSELGAADDPRDELAALVASTRAYVEWLEDTGAPGVPASPPSARSPASAEPRAPAPAEPRAPASTERSRPAPAPPEAAPAPIVAAVAAPVPSAAATDDERRVKLALLAEEVRGCTACRLHETRTNTVFARGNPFAELVFVGEGPGADEDAQGEPFVGKAGQLLDRMIIAMGYQRDDVYVMNCVKCRPPENRKPQPDEMDTCAKFFAPQVALVAPRAIVALGGTAVQGLLGTTEGITRLRGKWKLYKGKVPVMPTFHPAYLLRTPAAKREVWADLQEVMKVLGKSRGA